MDSKYFINQCIKTESRDMTPVYERQQKITRLNHVGQGLTTESAEFVDALKKHTFYGRPLDTVNLKEELSDALWYIAVACDELNTNFEELMQMNIAKLQKRYGDKFTEEAALNRDIDSERALLEEHAKPQQG